MNTMHRARARVILCLVLTMLSLVTSPTCVSADQEELVKEPFPASLARARRSGRPLVVFGLVDTCVRCQAVKEGIATDPDFQLLMTQYESSQIMLGGKEFAEVFRDIVSKDSSIPKAIGSPSVFIFTSKGNLVYAGPDRQEGIALGDEFKTLLISGIEKNGGLRAPGALPPADARRLSTDLGKARRFLEQNDPLKAAAILSDYELSSDEDAEHLSRLSELTGMSVDQTKTGSELDELFEQLVPVAEKQLAAAVEMGASGRATLGAVKLAELQRCFGKVPSLQPKWEPAWNDLQSSAGIPGLAEQARMIDLAREAEGREAWPEAVALYEKVVTAYPDTESATLSAQRVAQLRVVAEAKPRVWKSKNGQFSVTATLLSFDGTTAKLKSRDNKVIDVPAAALSDDDQQHLREQQR